MTMLTDTPVSWYRVDVVLLSGDLANVPMENMTSLTTLELEEQHALVHKVVSEFLPISKHIYFIPGNVSSRVLLVLSCLYSVKTNHSSLQYRLYFIEFSRCGNLCSGCNNNVTMYNFMMHLLALRINLSNDVQI